MSSADEYQKGAIKKFKEKKYSECIKFCDHSLKLNPQNPSLLNLKAIALSSLKRYDEAKKVLEEAIKLDPINATYQKNLEKVEIRLLEEDVNRDINPKLEEWKTSFSIDPSITKFVSSVILIIIFVCICILISNYFAPRNADTHADSNNPISTPVPTITPQFETQDVTENTVRNKYMNMETLKFSVTNEFEDKKEPLLIQIESFEKNGETTDKKTVKIRYLLEKVWDAKHFMTIACSMDTRIAYNMFKNPQIERLILETEIPLEDKYGNEKREVGLIVIIDRKTSDKINYEKFPMRVTGDYNTLLNVATDYEISPSIKSDL
ncbi:MAG: tetratricopeptide repeat protein [Methanomicrobiales archaeon]|nr:tetratricopeptide repeat protein [Methanomicrobiales archaeon]